MPHAISDDYDRGLYQPVLHHGADAGAAVFHDLPPQKKQEKKDAAMRKSLEIGDQVTTIGGVIGRVVAIKDDTFVLETGADRIKIRFLKTAISAVEKLDMSNAPATSNKK